jgi:putative DNA primase/helicase
MNAPEERVERPDVNLIEGELPLVVDLAEAASLESTESIFQRGGMLVRPVRRRPLSTRALRRQADSLGFLPVDSVWLREHLTRCANFMRFDKRAETWRRVNCPPNIAETLLARSGHWRYRHLVGAVSAPTLRPDGSLLQDPGYDEATGLVFDPGSTDFPRIKEQAETRQNAEKALQTLRASVTCTFPFVSEADESVALALILTALVRRALPAAPLGAITAPIMASGKTLLADLIAIIATGTSAAAMTHPSSEEETAKVLLSVLLDGDPIVLLDNVDQPLRSEALCSVLTSESFSGRLLGQSRTVVVPTSATFLATGNSLQIAGDLRTRAVLCRLDPRCENPEQRQFRGDLRVSVAEMRPSLVVAGLVIMRAFIRCGGPASDYVLPWGRFERWSDLVRAPLVWLGLQDPCASARVLEAEDPERARHLALLQAWRTAFGDERRTVREAIDLALRSGEQLNVALEGVCRDRSGQLDALRLGKFLQRVAGRIVGGMEFRREGESRGSACWRVVDATHA